jgi:hypothetical protein
MRFYSVWRYEHEMVYTTIKKAIHSLPKDKRKDLKFLKAWAIITYPEYHPIPNWVLELASE